MNASAATIWIGKVRAMKVAASYMAAYLLALYYCSRDDEHAPEEAVKFALNRYISDFCKEDAQTQLQEACDESDDLGYTEEYGNGPRTLTARDSTKSMLPLCRKATTLNLSIQTFSMWITGLTIMLRQRKSNHTWK